MSLQKVVAPLASPRNLRLGRVDGVGARQPRVRDPHHAFVAARRPRRRRRFPGRRRRGGGGARRKQGRERVCVLFVRDVGRDDDLAAALADVALGTAAAGSKHRERRAAAALDAAAARHVEDHAAWRRAARGWR